MAPDPVSDRPDRATDPNAQTAETAETAELPPTEAADQPTDRPTEAADPAESPGSPDLTGSLDSPEPLESAEELAEEIDPVPTLEVAGAGLRGMRGWVFRDVSLTARTGEITTLTGPSGTGRSTLLLACAGRLRLTEGSVAVHTHTPHRARVRDRVNVARIAGVIGLDPELSVTANVNDAADWARLRRSQARDLLATWRSRLDLSLPSALPAGELDAPELTLLHLLCATLGDPRAIVLDDLDADLTIEQIDRVWKLTAQIAAGRVSAPTAVIVSTVAALPPAGGEIVRLDAPEGADA